MAPKPAQKPENSLADLWPGQSVALLKPLHILTHNGGLNADSRRKLKQVQHLAQLIKPAIDAALAARTRRIVNPLDVVPHAWDARELRRMAGVYPQLALALEALAISVEPLEYRHVGGTRVELRLPL